MDKAFKIVKTALKIIFTLLFVGVLACVIYVMVCNTQGKVANIFGRSIMKVVTGSMEPSIHTGDYILIKKTDTSTLKVGDVICFYSEDESIYGMPNTHRIAAVNNDGSFSTKGDANQTEDEVSVSKDRIIGKYDGKIRFLHWLNSFASARKLLMLLVIIPMCLVAVYEVVTITRIKNQSDEDKEKLAQEEKQKLIRDAIEKEKQRLYEKHYAENVDEKAVSENESGKDNESENG